MGEVNIFTLCVNPHLDGGVPHHWTGGGYPITGLDWGGYPITGLGGGGYPIPGLDGGYPGYEAHS